MHALDDSVDMLGMLNLPAPPSLYLSEPLAGVVVPALVVPVDPTRLVREPGKLTDIVRKLAEARLALAQRLFRLDLLGDISIGPEPTDDITGLVADGTCAGQEPTIIAIAAA